MPYIPESEIARLKSQCDIVALIEGDGVELKRQEMPKPLAFASLMG